MTSVVVCNPKRRDGPAGRSGSKLEIANNYFRDEALRAENAERAVRPLGVLVLAEVFDDGACLGEDQELFAVEALIS